MLIKFGFILLQLIILLLPASSLHAEVNDYIIGNSSSKVTHRINSFFSQYPKKTKVLWQPAVYGKSRYAFSIYREAYNISKKYSDTSDLYYSTKQIDNKLSLHSTRTKNIDIYLISNNYKIKYKQNFSSNINAALFFQKKKKNSIGFILDKNFILFENSLGNLDVELTKAEYPLVQAKFVRLSNNENSESYLNIRHIVKSNTFDIRGNYTWFELGNQFDLTAGLNRQNKYIYSEIYATVENEERKFQFGFNKIKSMSDVNIFFSINFENLLGKRNLSTNLITNSDNLINYDTKLSLKDLRKKSLDAIWRKEIYFE